MEQENDIAKMNREKCVEHSCMLEEIEWLIHKKLDGSLNSDGNMHFEKENYAELQELLTQMKQILLEYEAEYPNGLEEASSRGDEKQSDEGREDEEEKQSRVLR